MKSWTPNRWAELMKLNGEFQLIRQATTQINPLLSVLGAVFPKLGTSIHGVTRKLELYLGKWKLFQWFGMNTVLIFKNIK
ncbi:MAG: hypothetical protein IPM91_19375 [Bacteroidetes bacterium]|nr:hypothetical protein [Bacteroidota bacterium]